MAHIRVKHNFIWRLRSFVRFLTFKLYYPVFFNNCKLGLIGNGSFLYFDYPGSSVRIGHRIIIANYVELLAKGKLNIGENFSVSEYSRIVAHDHIEIGNFVTIARFVSILDHDHHIEMRNGKMELQSYDLAPIRIGNNVWIGDKVSILKGAKIGSNIIIAANSVVKGKLEDNGIYAGAPAKRIKDIK
jgi:acetyltransferase-like isoleucine patch superfamily enzyme